MTEICPVTRAEKILLATDGSEYSEGAVREAINLAKKCGSQLTALSVIDTNPEFDALAPQIMEKKERQARQTVEAIQARAKQQGIECAAVVREGEDSYKSIIDEASKNKCTIIVMGRRGRTGLKRLVMGSVTARVIGHSRCNVLVVPKAATLDFKSITVATDGSKYSVAAASEAIGLAKKNNSSLTAIAVAPQDLMTPIDLDVTIGQREMLEQAVMKEAEKNAKAVKDAAQKEGVSTRALVLSGGPADVIIETAKEAKADLIVVGSHGRAGLDRLLMGSVAERVIVLAQSAVLVVKIS